jgi:DNA-binding response OmpR family regulator
MGKLTKDFGNRRQATDQAPRYSIRLAENASTGLNAVAAMRPAPIILDVGLPDMSGIDVLIGHRSSAPRCG